MLPCQAWETGDLPSTQKLVDQALTLVKAGRGPVWTAYQREPGEPHPGGLSTGQPHGARTPAGLWVGTSQVQAAGLFSSRLPHTH